MQVISPNLIHGKTVLLRLDLDVPIKNGQILDDFRLEAGLETLEMCLSFAKSTIIMGHIGRPEGKEDPALSVKPIVEWLEQKYQHLSLPEGTLHVLENLRFEKGEDEADRGFAKELAKYGDFYVNEAFASHHEAASTTVLPTLLPHAAGLNFAEEVVEIKEAMEDPKRPFLAIIGGVKVEDKLPAVLSLAKSADIVLVGGKIAQTLRDQELKGEIPIMPSNVHLAKLNNSGLDISLEDLKEWQPIISQAKTILWNGPLGKVEDPGNRLTKEVAAAVVESGAYTLIGGGDTFSYLDSVNLLKKFSFVSTGGGAMLELITSGTLPTIEALK
jgi:phosphoglycerate kinase